jgi:uncharacterized protein YfaA (DUF2138 family)
MAHPSLDTSGFEKGTAFRAYLERNRAHALAGEAGFRAAASEIRALVRGTGGRFSANSAIDARRIARPLTHAADLAVDQARMFQLCLDIYRGVYPPVHAGSGGRRTHDPRA